MTHNEFRLGHDEFEKPRGPVRSHLEADGSRDLKLRREVWPGDTDLNAISEHLNQGVMSSPRRRM